MRCGVRENSHRKDTFPSSLQPPFGAFSSFSFGEFSFVLSLYPKFTLFLHVTSHSTVELRSIAAPLPGMQSQVRPALGYTGLSVSKMTVGN